MTAIEERIEAHYEDREVPYGKVYMWGPGSALVECACGQLMIAEEGAAACPRCGANYKGAVTELVGRPPKQEENRCPEHQEREEWLEDEEARSEYHECLFSGLFSGLRVTEDLNQLLDEFCRGYTELSGAKKA